MQQKATPLKGSPIPESLRKIFDDIVKACTRSSTKMDLHPDKHKENVLALLLKYAIDKFGQAVASNFQRIHEKTNPGLSYTFAQVSNAVVERTFHGGSCHAQAAYSLVEFAKNNIFNASLVCSRTGDTSTEHFYILLPDKQTFAVIAGGKDLFIRVTKNRFSDASTYVDPWSNQLCLWKDFQPNNAYTNHIRKTDQAVFKSFSHIFGNEKSIIERIIFCLKEYRVNLLSLPPANNLPIDPSKFPKDTDENFRLEVDLLTSHQKCIDALVSTTDLYLSEFNSMLNIDNARLLSSTTSFFKAPLQAKWIAYPKASLSNTKHDGHVVYYLTLKDSEAAYAPAFFQHLKTDGFSAEMKQAKENPSIVVDLSISKKMGI
jgi:hypothetical protein